MLATEKGAQAVVALLSGGVSGGGGAPVPPPFAAGALPTGGMPAAAAMPALSAGACMASASGVATGAGLSGGAFMLPASAPPLAGLSATAGLSAARGMPEGGSSSAAAALPSGPDDGVSALAFAPTSSSIAGRLLGAVSWDGTLRVWQSAAGWSAARLVHVHARPSPLLGVAWLPSAVATAAVGACDGRVLLVDVAAAGGAQAPQVLGTHSAAARAVICVADLPAAVFSGGWDATARLWDTRAPGPSPAATVTLPGPVACAAACWPRVAVGTKQGQVALFDLRKPAGPLDELKCFPPPRAVAMTRDVVCTGSADGRLDVVSLADRSTQTLARSTAAINSLAVLPADGTLVSAASDGIVQSWDLGRRGPGRRIAQAPRAVACVAVDTDVVAYGASDDWTPTAAASRDEVYVLPLASGMKPAMGG